MKHHAAAIAALSAAFFLATFTQGRAVIIENFEVNLNESAYFSAAISWNPGQAQPTVDWAEVYDDWPDVMVWGVAFLSVSANSDSFDFITAPTDTGGDYGPETIDYFSLPLGHGAVFSAALNGAVIPSHFWEEGYQVSPHPETPYGLFLTAGSRRGPRDLQTARVPDGGSTLALLGLGLGGCGWLARRRQVKRGA